MVSKKKAKEDTTPVQHVEPVATTSTIDINVEVTVKAKTTLTYKGNIYHVGDELVVLDTLADDLLDRDLVTLEE